MTTADDRMKSFEATLAHIARIKEKRERLAKAQKEAEDQLLANVRRMHEESGDIDELNALYERYRSVAESGYGKRWNEVIPVTWMKLNARRRELEALAAALIERKAARWQPNGANGSFHGVWPLVDPAIDPRPRYGVAVVYVLYDERLDPCYVGSTEDFSHRLDAHRRDGKEFVRWCAFPCADREAAYRLEDQLLREVKPYLNRKASR